MREGGLQETGENSMRSFIIYIQQIFSGSNGGGRAGLDM
jgi:hypothetical protein